MEDEPNETDILVHLQRQLEDQPLSVFAVDHQPRPARRLRQLLLPGVQPPEHHNVTPDRVATTRVRNAGGRVIHAKNWVFTLRRIWVPTIPPGARYITGQQEQAPNPSPNNTNNGLHWQGYVEFHDRVNELQVCNAFNWPPHTEHDRRTYVAPRAGSQHQAVAYCQKDETAIHGTRFEFGEKAPPDAPGAWTYAVDDVRSGYNFNEMCVHHTAVAIRHASGLQKVISALEKPPLRKDIKVYCFWGKTGTGKTRLANAVGGESVFTKCNDKFFDGYENELTIVFDEYSGFACGNNVYNIDDLLRWLDIHPLRVGVKGSYRNAKWTRVIFTSNYHPSAWYPTIDETKKAAFYRRLPPTNIYNLRNPVLPDTEFDPMLYPDEGTPSLASAIFPVLIDL